MLHWSLYKSRPETGLLLASLRFATIFHPKTFMVTHYYCFNLNLTNCCERTPKNLARWENERNAKFTTRAFKDCISFSSAHTRIHLRIIYISLLICFVAAVLHFIQLFSWNSPKYVALVATLKLLTIDWYSLRVRINDKTFLNTHSCLNFKRVTFSF